MPLPTLRQCLHAAGIVAAYANPFYAVPATIVGGTAFQLLRGAGKSRQDEDAMFFMLVPGAPLLLPVLAIDVANAALGARRERQAVARRNKRMAQALMLLTILFYKNSVWCRFDKENGVSVVSADVNEGNIDGFHDAVRELLRSHEGRFTPQELLARIRPNASFDDDWLRRNNFARPRAA